MLKVCRTRGPTACSKTLATEGVTVFEKFLLFYCDLISCTNPACFSTFYQCVMVPTLVENSNFFCVYFFVNNYYDC